MEMIINYLPLFGVLALGFVFWKNAWVSKQDEGNAKMQRIAKNIADVAVSKKYVPILYLLTILVIIPFCIIYFGR